MKINNIIAQSSYISSFNCSRLFLYYVLYYRSFGGNSMKIVEKIEFIQTDYPLSAGLFSSWKIGIESLNPFLRTRVMDFMIALLSLTDGNAQLDRFIVKVDDIPLSLDVLLKYDLKKSLEVLRNDMIMISPNGEVYQSKYSEYYDLGVSYPTKMKNIIERYVKALGQIEKHASSSQDGKKYLGIVSIEKNVLCKRFKDSSGKEYLRIRSEFIPFLRFLDLSDISFSNVDIRGLDLSYTNGAIDLNCVYKKSAENTNLEGAFLSRSVIRNCCLKGANLLGTGAIINSETCIIDDCKVDDSISLVSGEKTVGRQMIIEKQKA